MNETSQLILLALCWLAYGGLHSLLAAEGCKSWVRKRFPDGYRGYRLAYNLLAGLLLIIPGWLLLSYPGRALWTWPAPVALVMDAAALLAVGGFVWSTRFYDNREFLGISQLSIQAGDDVTPPMRISSAHRWVRHPWYFLGLVVIWTREMNAALLISALCLTLYLIAGAHLEEHKLIARYGQAYRRYRNRVPGLIPLPWRRLSEAEAALILNEANAENRVSVSGPSSPR